MQQEKHRSKQKRSASSFYTAASAYFTTSAYFPNGRKFGSIRSSPLALWLRVFSSAPSFLLGLCATSVRLGHWRPCKGRSSCAEELALLPSMIASMLLLLKFTSFAGLPAT